MGVVARLAFRMLWARRGLYGVATLGVFLGVLVLVAINGILQGFQQKFLLNIIEVSPHVSIFDKELRRAPPLLTRYYDDFVAGEVAHAVPSDRKLRIRRPTEMERAIERLPDVEAASRSVVGSAVMTFGAKDYSVDLRGIEPAAQDRVTPISRYVRSGDYMSLAREPEGVLLGVGVSRRIGARVGDTLRAASPAGRPMTLKVVGIFDAGIPPVDNYRAYVRIRDAQTILGVGDAINRLEVRLSDPALAVAAADELEATFGYDAESWQETNANFLAIFRQQAIIIELVVAAILAVGGFGIFAVEIMIILQKTRDIAILRSLGFTRQDILVVFLLQGITIALAGAALGDIGGHYVLKVLGTLRIPAEGVVRSDTFMVFDSPSFYVYGVVFALGVGLVASLAPGLRAARVEPVDILRGQIG
jgi:lipoprotein-releasing system permease protein